MKNIIIIDDDPLSIYVNSMVLEEALDGPKISSFTMVEDALEHFSKPDFVPPQLILLDINLPALDAWDFLECLNQQSCDNKTLEPKSLPIVLISSYISPSDRDQIQAHGMEHAVLTKPLKVDELLGLGMIK